jgi:hypothetical protein
MPVPQAPAARAVTPPAPAPRPAMPNHPPMQRDMQRGREPEARVRAPEQPRGQSGREQMR